MQRRVHVKDPRRRRRSAPYLVKGFVTLPSTPAYAAKAGIVSRRSVAGPGGTRNHHGRLLWITGVRRGGRKRGTSRTVRWRRGASPDILGRTAARRFIPFCGPSSTRDCSSATRHDSQSGYWPGPGTDQTIRLREEIALRRVEQLIPESRNRLWAPSRSYRLGRHPCRCWVMEEIGRRPPYGRLRVVLHFRACR